MHNLVTGGSGFVGTHLADRLCRRGERVRVLDIAEPRSLPDGADFVCGSVTDQDTVSKAMSDIDAVFHLAANAHLWARDKRDYPKINTGGTIVVLDAAAQAGVKRIVHGSSLTVLVGNHGRHAPITVNEDTVIPLEDMVGPYCRSKHLADQAAMRAAKQGAPVTIILPTLPIGPGDHGLTPPTRMILNLLHGKTPAYLQCLLNLIDVRDVAEGAILARDRGLIGERYILGRQDLWMSELLQKLQKLTGVSMPTRRVPYGVAIAAAFFDEWTSDWITRCPPRAPLTGVKLAGRKIRFDSNKAANNLGLTYRNLDDTLKDQLHWFFKYGLTDRDLSAAGAARS